MQGSCRAGASAGVATLRTVVASRSSDRPRLLWSAGAVVALVYATWTINVGSDTGSSPSMSSRESRSPGRARRCPKVSRSGRTLTDALLGPPRTRVRRRTRRRRARQVHRSHLSKKLAMPPSGSADSGDPVEDATGQQSCQHRAHRVCAGVSGATGSPHTVRRTVNQAPSLPILFNSICAAQRPYPSLVNVVR
jgi:hypothetical protein